MKSTMKNRKLGKIQPGKCFLKTLPLLLAAFVGWQSTSPAADITPVFPQPDRIRYDSHCLQIEGKDTFIYSGAFHYFRCPKELWRNRFQKIKEAGFNTVETYVPWNWHEREMPQSPDDFSKVDLTELEEWLDMAEEFGFYVIIRPGPYICSEWSGGGYPQWLVALKKPADWDPGKSWLQTDNPEYLAWSRHWYQAVCRVVAKHQITRQPAGAPGVILFQIENEYERLNWLPRDMKKRHLEVLATTARDGGIDVPLVTCWTKESRSVKEGPLLGVFDFVNMYPKWEVEKKLRDYSANLRQDQPYAPLMSMELQAGWYSEVGGLLSENINGVASVQTQNITLYCLQLGYAGINYYMLVGGSNFDDWASRETTATYDFFAPIREHGGVGEKYQRVWAMGHMLREHGARLARSEPVEIAATVSDSAVQVAERRAADGSRYLFVRTEDRQGHHFGMAQVKEKDGTQISFPFELEPFGAKVLCLPPGVTNADAGEWLPKPAPAIARPGGLPSPVIITEALRAADPLPGKWTKLPPGDTLEKHGIFDRHFVYYRVAAPAGRPFSVGRLGDKVVNNTRTDGVLAWVDGILLSEKSSDTNGVTFETPAGAEQVALLYENRGLHQHTRPELENHWLIGIRGVKMGETNLPVEFAVGERERGIQFSGLKLKQNGKWSRVAIGHDVAPMTNSLLTWHRLAFDLPAKNNGVWVPWHLHLEAAGNGFIYVNGRCLGRYWQAGPQRDFFLPESWLNFGPGQTNVVAISVRPVDKCVCVRAASVVPDAAFAEYR
jgi:hypothetical protein